MSGSAQGHLVVDVGMHDGSDTEFYLSAGYRVLAIEANPELVEQVSQRLRRHLDSGQLRIEHLAIADQAGSVDFYVGGESLWASTNPDWAVRSHTGDRYRRYTVRAATLDMVLDGEVPHYVKIDIEGSDEACLRALGRLPAKPAFVSFEADLGDPEATDRMLALVAGWGYRRFKLVNQAMNAGHNSGPFGDAAPGQWVPLEGLRERLARVTAAQATRTAYTQTGRVAGIPIGPRLHRMLRWVYNTLPVRWARLRWAAARGVEPGGWFDIHAAL